MKFKILSIVLSVVLLAPSCLKDLDREPFNQFSSVQVYNDPANYIHVLAKLYAGLAVTGQVGPAGNSDLPGGIDEGFSQYVRMFWNLQELPTDEVVCRWNDQGIPELNKGTWTATNLWIRGGYLRFLFQITMCNEFIKQSRRDRLESRGFSNADIDRISNYREEARFLRALSLFHALDIFGNIPDITDENKFPGTEFPTQFNRTGLFSFIESELLDIEDKILTRNLSEYARANRACVQVLLAKLYLNAPVFINQNRNDRVITYCERVINQGGYTLQTRYTDLFRADNHSSSEIIFPIVSDGSNALSFGGTTFLINASGFPTTFNANTQQFTAWGSSFPSVNLLDTTGSTQAWQGLIATNELLAYFNDSTLDSRYQFVTTGRTGDITVIPNSPPTQGFVVKKWRNLSSNNVPGPNNNFSNTDFPLFRLADVYLMYAEAHLRGGGGNLGTALQLVNALRERAYGNSNFNFTNLTLDDILAERARELYWEGYRRTDLIRFSKFVGSEYLWTWKGDQQAGNEIPNYRLLYPLPATELTANPNLQQNAGY
jgi:hypothetical protein